MKSSTLANLVWSACELLNSMGMLVYEDAADGSAIIAAIPADNVTVLWHGDDDLGVDDDEEPIKRPFVWINIRFGEIGDIISERPHVRKVVSFKEDADVGAFWLGLADGGRLMFTLLDEDSDPTILKEVERWRKLRAEHQEAYDADGRGLLKAAFELTGRELVD